jgi:hypothetical protein
MYTIHRTYVSAQMRNLPVPEVAVPFPVLVPVPEVRNPISGTALTIHFLRFLLGHLFSHERLQHYALTKIT